VRGLHVAVGAATPQIAEAIDRVLGWHDADDLDRVDASIFVRRMTQLPGALAAIDRWVLEKRSAFLRRRVAVTGAHSSATLLLVPGADPAAPHHHLVFGGDPFVRLELNDASVALQVSRIIASGAAPGDALLDLLSEGDGVIRNLSATAVAALAAWLEKIEITAASSQ
jgi:hypothetical protein